MATKINKSNRILVCRYCLKDSNKVSQYYFISDDTEEFQKMITDTFNIQICHIKSMDRKICLQCIENLRLAANVKKQILDVQKTLLAQCEILTDLGCESPKEELYSSGFDDFGYDDSTGDDLKSDVVCKELLDNPTLDTLQCSMNEENYYTKEIDIKIEPDEINETPPLKKKSTYKRISKRTRKLYLGADGIKHIKQKVECRKNDKGKPIPSTKTRSRTRNSSSMLDSLRILRNNTLKLLINSNMCPFISKRTKFSCYSCSESYLNIRELREHSLSHSIDYELKTDISRCRGLSFKNVDISNLSCKVCSDPCTDINSLREHLIDKHDVHFGSAEHFLLPFKLEEGLNCVICQEQYFTFTRLSIHMNTHSTGNVCETCGVAYVNRRSLRNHINSLHKEKQCTKCPAVFPTSSAKAKHMRIAHNNAHSKRYCMKCEMTFKYTHQLKEHMIEKHGEKRQEADCEHCGKKFAAVANLRVHIRSVHIGERNYPCSICELRFFTSCDKVRHEKTHGDAKAFSCDYCEVKFKSKDSQRRHLRKQHGKSKTNS